MAWLNKIQNFLGDMNRSGMFQALGAMGLPEIGIGGQLISSLIGSGQKAAGNFKKRNISAGIGNVNDMIQSIPMMPQGIKQLSGNINNAAQLINNPYANAMFGGGNINNNLGSFGGLNPLEGFQQPSSKQDYGQFQQVPNYYPYQNGQMGKRQQPYGGLEDDQDFAPYAPPMQRNQPQYYGPSGGGMETMGGPGMMSNQMQPAPPQAFLRPPTQYMPSYGY